MIYSIIRLHKMGVDAPQIVLRALDVITIIVPPALPMAMTVGISFAIWRLRKLKIFCISPNKVNISGKLTCICFDKTGTLTESGVTLVGAWPVSFPTYDLIRAENIASKLPSAPFGDIFTYAITTCHSLTYMKQDLVGDTMELNLFKHAQWLLKDPSAESPFTTVSPSDIMLEGSAMWSDDSRRLLELQVLHRFEFASQLQRMSVVVRDRNNDKYYYFLKGSPEVVRSLSQSQTVPDNYAETLEQYVTRGYRVLGFAFKEISPFEVDQPREILEQDLNFLGLVILQNNLKRDTIPTIKELKEANIDSVMVTGDNALTAVAVARQSGLLALEKRIIVSNVTRMDDLGNPQEIEWRDTTSDNVFDTATFLAQEDLDDYELVVTGPVFDYLLGQHRQHNLKNSRSYLQQVLMLCHVFARMSPNQKLLLSEELQHLDYFVGFCGDGINDSGALKASHVGVSLSESETGISAPFTSLNPNISCIPRLIREGRAALSLSFQLFKFMSAYSFIQFFAVLLLYRINSNLGDSQVSILIIYRLIVILIYISSSYM
jgi:cation-transporting ATPase 13A2